MGPPYSDKCHVVVQKGLSREFWGGEDEGGGGAGINEIKEDLTPGLK